MFDSDSLVPAGKTGLLILLAGLFAASSVMAVDCTPENITLQTQEEVDNFQQNHGPGCDTVTGSLAIRGAEIFNLGGLSNLSLVGNYLGITNTELLSNLDGLENLVSVRGLSLDANSLLESIDALSNVSGTLPAILNITGNSSLQNLDGLQGITRIGEHFFLKNNESLFHIRGLTGITEISGRVEIWYNDSLENLDGLQQLTHVSSWLDIRLNDSLTSLDGLSGLSSVDSNLRILYNPALSNIDDLYSLEVVAGNLEIASDALLNVDGLEGLTQVGGHFSIAAEEIENLDGLARLTSVNKLSFYDGKNLSDIGGLSALTTISDGLYIDRCPLLVSLSPLSGVTEIGGHIFLNNNDSLASLDGIQLPADARDIRLTLQFNDSLVGLDALAGVTRIADLTLNNNPSITSLESLSSLEAVDEGLQIVGSGIADLSGLESLVTIGGTLSLSAHEFLTNVEGLSSLSQVGAAVIGDNSSLIHLNGLASLVSVASNMRVDGNAQLSDCSGLIPLVDDIDDGEPGPGPGPSGIPDVGAELFLQDNQPACNFREAILGGVDDIVTTKFQVAKEHSDDNPSQIAVWLACDGSAKVVPDFEEAWDNLPAEFTVSRPSSETTTCSVYEYANNSGYTVDKTDCSNVVIPDDEAAGCTIYLNQNPVQVQVNKIYTDDSSAEITVTLNCDSGSPRAIRSSAVPGTPAIFKVWDFHYNGTKCSAAESSPAGYYQEHTTCERISVRLDSRAECTFTNSPSDPPPPPPPMEPDPTALTGSWYDPASSGEGFVFHSVTEDLAVGYFYGYDDDGNRLWLVGTSEGPFVWDSTIIFEAITVDGGWYGDIEPELIQRSEWGAFEITLRDCEYATASIYGDLGEKDFQLQRIAGVSGTACGGDETTVPTDSVTGSWYEPETSGQGFAVHKISEDRGVVYFYGFDDEGANLWLLGVWEEPLEFGQELTIPLDQTSGGFFGQFDPEDIVVEPWGTLLIRFDDCENGIAIMNGLDGRQELDIHLLAGSFGLECQAPSNNGSGAR